MKQQHGRLTIFQAAAVDDPRLGHAAFRVLAALGAYSDPEGWCWPKQATLAERLRISQQAVSKSLRQLADLGYIEVHQQTDARGMRVGAKYRLRLDHFPPQPQVVPLQREVVADTTSEVVADTTSEVVADTTSEVVALTSHTQRPKKNDPRRTTQAAPARLEAGFAQFWQRWPKKEGRERALRVWLKLAPDGDTMQAILDAIPRHQSAKDWPRENWRFCPLPATWLNERRWEDELPDMVPDGGTGAPQGRDRERMDAARRFLERRGVRP